MNNDCAERVLGRLRRPNGKDLADSLITSGHVRPYDGVNAGLGARIKVPSLVALEKKPGVPDRPLAEAHPGRRGSSSATVAARRWGGVGDEKFPDSASYKT